MADTFEDFMRKESEYRKYEYNAIEVRDYKAADFYHKKRWQFLEEAARVLAEGMEING